MYDRFDFPKDGKVINDDGQTPWHLAMSAKHRHGIKVCEILCSYHIDRSIKDKHGRRADCRIRGSDQRLVCFHKVEQIPTESSDVWTSITSHLENIFTKENDYFTKVPDVHQDDNSSQDVNNGENNNSESISSLHEASPEPPVFVSFWSTIS